MRLDLKLRLYRWLVQRGWRPRWARAKAQAGGSAYLDSARQQRLIDALQAAALRAQRLAATTDRQQEDARACVAAIARAIAEVRPSQEGLS